jgi:phosphate/sulfate permease
MSRSLTRGARNHGFRIGQVGSACMVSLAHGTNDAQKTMGVITLALIANGTLATGSIIGTGLGKKGADVRWKVAGRMATAWLFTLPSAAVAGALAYWLAHGIGGSLGVIILLAILTGLSGAIDWRSRSTKVDHSNVNDEWTGGVAPSEPEPAAAA